MLCGWPWVRICTMSKRLFERARMGVHAGVVLMVAPGVAAAQTEAWPLETTAQRVLEQAPERSAAAAEVKARQGVSRQAGVWPNPTVELGADNSLGKEDGQGGVDLTQLRVSQPLPE